MRDRNIEIMRELCEEMGIEWVEGECKDGSC